MRRSMFGGFVISYLVWESFKFKKPIKIINKVAERETCYRSQEFKGKLETEMYIWLSLAYHTDSTFMDEFVMQ